MFEAFSKDKSSFRSIMFLMLLFISFCFVGSMYFYKQYVAQTNENIKLKETYRIHTEWIQKFDYGSAVKLKERLLKPCKATEIERVQQEQLLLLQKHHLTVLSVKNSEVKQDTKLSKGTTMKSVKTSIMLEGTWADIIAALNEFEKSNLVVITKLNLFNDLFIKASIEYAIYYN